MPSRRSPPPAETPPLSNLPGLGPRSQAMLSAAGIHTLDELRRLGSVAAFVQVKQAGQPASLNLLWGMESALTGIPWEVISKEHRTSLLLALDQFTRSAPDI